MKERHTKPTTAAEREMMLAAYDLADRGVTHYDGCWRNHPRCWARRLMEDADELDEACATLGLKRGETPDPERQPDHPLAYWIGRAVKRADDAEAALGAAIACSNCGRPLEPGLCSICDNDD